MATTYELITKTTLSATTTSITLSTIPQTYTDLRIVSYGKGTSGDDLVFQVNTNTGINYAAGGIQSVSNDAPVRSHNFSGNTGRFSNDSLYLNTNYPGLWITDILNYTNNGAYKTCLHSIYGSYADSANAEGVGKFSSIFVGTTNAITSITCKILSSNFQIGFNVSIYGILKHA